MNRQITVRLPDDQVDFLDAEVSAGHAVSRAAAIVHALRREQQRRRTECDLETVLAARDDPELTALQDWVGHRTYPDLD